MHLRAAFRRVHGLGRDDMRRATISGPAFSHARYLTLDYAFFAVPYDVP